MAFVPYRFLPKAAAAALFPTFDRFANSDADTKVEPVKGTPFAAGCMYHLAFCQPWAPPFELDEADLFDC